VTSALVLGTGAAGLAALAGAAALAAGVRRRRRPTARFRVPVALAAALWGAGALVAATRDAGTPPGGSWWTVATAALAVTGATLLPRAPEPLHRSRLAAEAVLLGSALSLLMWNLAAPPPGTPGAEVAGTFTLIVLDGALVALLLLTAARDLDPGVAVATLGGSLQIAACLAEPSATWLGTALAAAGWLLLAAGLLAVVPAGTAQPEPIEHRQRAERRRLVVSTCVPLSLAIAATVVYSSRGITTGGTHLALTGAFVTAALTRELIRGVQQGRLMRLLADQAATDPMTGLGNRRALATELARLDQSPDREASVLTVDLDGFKDINTLLGLRTGDVLLVAVARELDRLCAAAGGRAFRLGGDEFAVLVTGAPDAAEALAQQLLAAMPDVVARVPGAARVDVSASVGVAHREPGGDLVATLTHSGDAMRAAKAAGRARTLTYGTPMARRRSRSAAIERELRRRVVDGHGLEVHLQPVISLGEMRMTGMESLARWGDDAELGAVSPAEFIPIAEDTGLIVELGMQMLRKTILTNQWTGAQDAGLVGGVNVSPLQLRSAGFVQQVGDLLQELGCPPKQVVIEITESVHIEHDDPAVPAILGLAELGLIVALDDFGAGYSSLSYLNQLPVRILKLDRSLTQRLGEARGLAIARCVSEMAKELGIDVVAEGIETPEHLAAVRRLSVGFGQGWLFSRAVPPERFAELVRNPALALGIPANTA
jgi:diguanylate cyclase (GGDEF)-like protein